MEDFATFWPFLRSITDGDYCMKYLFALAFILLAGCSIFPYSPGGEYYVAPGTFTGTWVITSFDSTEMLGDTNSCTAMITECDENLVATITNESTKEVLSLRGTHSSSTNGGSPTHVYIVTDQSNLGDSDLTTHFDFSPNGDAMEYYGVRAISGFPSLDIFCVRN
jgi:hypothetical protein